MDFSAFESNPSRDEIKSYYAAHPEQQHLPRGTREPNLYGKQNIKSFSLIIGSAMIAVVSFTVEATVKPTQPLAVMLGVFATIGVGLTLYMFIRLHFRNLHYRKALGVQLSKFAQNNNFQYRRYQKITSAEGILGPASGTSLNSEISVTTKNESITTSQYEVADLFIASGRGNRYLSYMYIPLSVTLPHVILESFGYYASISKPSGYVTIEIDPQFARKFRLYATAEGQKLASSVFTPELLGLLNENFWSTNTGVEIINTSIYVYITVDWTDKAFWNRTQKIYSLITHAVATQTETANVPDTVKLSERA